MNSCLVRPPEAACFLAQGKPAKEAPLAGRKDAGRRSRCPWMTPMKPGPLRIGYRSCVMRRGWFNVWSALAITLALLGAPLHAQFAYVANDGGNNVSGYTIDPITGALTPIGTFTAGSLPISVAADPSGKFAYVANGSDPNGTVSGYTINPATGALTDIAGSPFPAGSAPRSVAVDPSGKFAYVANSGDNNVSAYSIDSTTGALSQLSISPFAAGSAPLSVAVDPSGKFAYVANFNSNNVSAYTIDSTTGALSQLSI